MMARRYRSYRPAEEFLDTASARNGPGAQAIVIRAHGMTRFDRGEMVAVSTRAASASFEVVHTGVGLEIDATPER